MITMLEETERQIGVQQIEQKHWDYMLVTPRFPRISAPVLTYSTLFRNLFAQIPKFSEFSRIIPHVSKSYV